MARRFTVTADEARIDRIARDLYGSEGEGAVERLLAANPGLAARLAATHGFARRGDSLVVPDPAAPAPDPAFVRPWD